jgi:phosphopentomutase
VAVSAADGDRATHRAIVVVIDACGVGALPDADRYGDEGANTLAHVAEAVGGLELPTLARLGLGSIISLRGVPPVLQAAAIHGRLHPLGPGKDSIAGHWELMGVVATSAAPTYPDGFPPEIVDRLRKAMGHELICNRPYNGIAAVEHFGAEHLRTGALILYTSQDSVLQLAAHADRVPEGQLYRACDAARVTRWAASSRDRSPAAPGRSSARRAGATLPFRLRGAATSRSCAKPAFRSTAWARSATCSPASASSTHTPPPPTRVASPSRPRCSKRFSGA